MKRVLFLDDRSNRIHSAIRHYAPPEYELTIVTTAKECIKKLNDEEWDIVSLDHDLDFDEFVPQASPNTGMVVARYIEEYEWPDSKFKTPEFIIHSSNRFAAGKMHWHLNGTSSVCIRPWKYPQYYKSVIAGAFDVIHPGYIRLMKKAKELSSHLTIALNVSPEGKTEPVLSADEREEILYGIRYVDKVLRYETEKELTDILVVLNRGGSLVRVMGNDHEGDSSRSELNILCFYLERCDWSATRLKKLYAEQIK